MERRKCDTTGVPSLRLFLNRTSSAIADFFVTVIANRGTTLPRPNPGDRQQPIRKPMNQSTPTPPGQPEPGWKVLLRRVFLTFFFVLWGSGVLLFFTMVRAHNAGESRPTATHTVPLTQHGNTKYVTPAEQHRIGLLLRTLVIGLPGELLFGVILYFGFRVNVWGNKRRRPKGQSQ